MNFPIIMFLQPMRQGLADDTDKDMMNARHSNQLYLRFAVLSRPRFCALYRPLRGFYFQTFTFF